MRLKYRNRNLYFTDNDTLVADVQSATLTAFNMHSYNWTKKYATITAVYDALNATNYTDTEKVTNSGEDNVTEQEKNTGTSQNAETGDNTGTQTINNARTPQLQNGNYSRTYDDQTLNENSYETETGSETTVNTRTDDLKDSRNNTLTNNLQKDVTNTTTYGHITDRSRTVTGRDNIPAQDLIMKEREVAEYNFYEMIADEIADFITTLNYNYGDAEESEVDNYGF